MPNRHSFKYNDKSKLVTDFQKKCLLSTSRSRKRYRVWPLGSRALASPVGIQMKQSLDSHEVRAVSVDDGAQGQAALPRHGEVRHVHPSVAICLPLAPAQQFAGTSHRL